MRATVRVPKTADRYDDAVEEVKRHFARVYGGFTTYDAEGGWVNNNGDLIEESVTVIETYGNVPAKGGLTQVAERVREITGETAVMGSIDDGEKILV